MAWEYRRKYLKLGDTLQIDENIEMFAGSSLEMVRAGEFRIVAHLLVRVEDQQVKTRVIPLLERPN